MTQAYTNVIKIKFTQSMASARVINPVAVTRRLAQWRVFSAHRTSDLQQVPTTCRKRTVVSSFPPIPLETPPLHTPQANFTLYSTGLFFRT